MIVKTYSYLIIIIIYSLIMIMLFHSSQFELYSLVWNINRKSEIILKYNLFSLQFLFTPLVFLYAHIPNAI